MSRTRRTLFIIRTLGLFIILIAIPIIILILGYKTKRIFESIVAVLANIQTLVVWAQAEISMRQNMLYKTSLEPYFAVGVRRSPKQHLRDSAEAKGKVEFVITNVSNVPAYDVMLSRILQKTGQPLMPDVWLQFSKSNIIPCLGPKSSTTLLVMDAKFFDEIVKKKCILEIHYQNLYGEIRSLRVFFHESKPHIVYSRPEMPGFLLRLFEDMRLLVVLYRMRKLMKSY